MTYTQVLKVGGCGVHSPPASLAAWFSQAVTARWLIEAAVPGQSSYQCQVLLLLRQEFADIARFAAARMLDLIEAQRTCRAPNQDIILV